MRRKARQFEQYQDMIARLYPEDVVNSNSSGEEKRTLSRTVTFQVTDACSLACTYCYQINKGKRRMSFETAKKFVDLILSGEKGFKEYVDPSFSRGLTLEFIGGEPFLEIDLIDQIVDYFFAEAIRLDHPWASTFMISICSNGVAYFDPKVQRFLNKRRSHISFSITIDGNKELHDSCRVFPDGRPSYDIAVAGAKDWMAKGNYMGSKITIAPENITYLFDAIKHMISLDYYEINANYVYEKGWEQHHTTELYNQMKRVTDYLMENDLAEDIYISLYVESFFKPKKPEDLTTWCGGLGDMLSCDPDGYLYPCIRYMESSLGTDVPPIRIGHVDTGIAQCEEHCNNLKCITCVNRRTYNTDECFYCPIGEGCSDCAAYNYQVNGTVNQRAIYICEMHKARALANAYHWCLFNQKYRDGKPYEMYISKEWALEIISEEEWDMLMSFPNMVYKGDKDYTYYRDLDLATKAAEDAKKEEDLNEDNEDQETDPIE